MARRYDLVVVGMGSGGLVAAELAARLRLRVAAVEGARFGGDCLWTGCVPSKSLVAAARVAHALRTADRFGLPAVDPEIDTEAVWRRMHAVREQIAASDDDPARYERMGVEVVSGRARLAGPNAVEVDGRLLETSFVLLCTGSRPRVPALPGLAEAGYLTSETIFDLQRPPRSLVVLGGGPSGVELAQACTRLGLGVSLLQRRPRLLVREEPELVDLLTETLRGEGVDVALEAEATAVSAADGRKVVAGARAGTAASWEGEEILVAAGREPNVEELGLAEVGVEVGPEGVVVDERCRTAVPSVYAVGDLTGGHLFTHAAGHDAAAAVRDMFFPGRAERPAVVPWCTFTDPELAHAGLTAAEAEERYPGAVEVARADLAHSDRARTDGAHGAILLVSAKGRLVGAHVLAPAAGELVHELALAVAERRRLRDLAQLVHVYPTISSSIVLLAAEAAYERAESLRWLVRARRVAASLLRRASARRS